MGYYPIYLDLRERPCVLIASTGALPEEVDRKVQGLVDAGARVTIISRLAPPGVARLVEEGRISLEQRSYREGDLIGVFLAIAATTDDLPLSQRVADEATRERVLLNLVDVTYLCTWIAPALVQRGDVTVAISTNGRSPAMARRVRQEVERAVPPEYGQLLDVVATVRLELRRRGIRPPAEAWQEALGADTMVLVTQRDWDAVQAGIFDHLVVAAQH